VNSKSIFMRRLDIMDLMGITRYEFKRLEQTGRIIGYQVHPTARKMYKRSEVMSLLEDLKKRE